MVFRKIFFFILMLIYGTVLADAPAPADTAQQSLDSLTQFLGMDVLSFTIEEVTSVTGAEFSFGVSVHGDSLLYSALRGNLYSKNQIESNEYFKIAGGTPQTDLYTVSRSGGAGVPFVPKVNTPGNEGAASLSPSGKELLYTRTELKDKKMRYYIGYALRTDSGWVENPANGFSSNMANFAYPCWDRTGERVYFCSDREGGAGGMDIYFAEKRKFGWSAPRLLPKGINTPGNELYPHVFSDTVLVFSTDGRSQYGGFDLVYAGIGSEYPVIQSLKQPANTADDDIQLFIIQDSVGKDSLLTGYVVSNRNADRDKLFSFAMQLGSRKAPPQSDSIITVEADFMLDERLSDYASQVLAELQQGLRDIYGSELSINIGTVSDGTDGLEKGKRLTKLSATVESSFEEEVQFLMANAVENILKKQQALESLEVAGLEDDKQETAHIEITSAGAMSKDVAKLMSTYANQLIRDRGIPAASSTKMHPNGRDQIVVFEASASSREKEQVADALRAMFGEIESNPTYYLTYKNGSAAASQLPTDYIFSGSMGVNFGRGSDRPKADRQLTVVMDDSVDVFIEVYDAADVYAGRKLKPSNRVKLKLPSMDFAVDVAIADASKIADFKTGQSGYNSITLYDKSYKDAPSADFNSSTMYTIQVAALQAPASADKFKDLVVNEYKCSDGVYRYTTGIARGSAGADRLLQQVRTAGFADAAIIEVNMMEKRLEKMYAVVVSSGPAQVPAYRFPAGWKVYEYKGKTDDLYRYTVGEFDKIESALEELNRIKKLGYKGAYLENIRRFNFIQTLYGAGK